MTLHEFLINIGTDADLFRRFKENPKQVVQEVGLSQQDSQVVLDPDPGKIRQVLSGGNLPAGVVVVVVVAVIK